MNYGSLPTKHGSIRTQGKCPRCGDGHATAIDGILWSCGNCGWDRRNVADQVEWQIARLFEGAVEPMPDTPV